MNFKNVIFSQRLCTQSIQKRFTKTKQELTFVMYHIFLNLYYTANKIVHILQCVVITILETVYVFRT